MKTWLVGLALVLVCARDARAACCYFSAQDKDVNQPGQKAFITWQPAEKRETFTVQPSFEGDARDFGLVIPTPSQPKLDEMPRDFFKHLALYTILLPMPERIMTPKEAAMPPPMPAPMAMAPGGPPGAVLREANGHGVRVLEAGVVGSLDYKIIEASRPTGLYEWLKENKYSYAGDEATLKHYIDKKWLFTVMKIDTKQMKKNPDGSYLGEVTPTRFAFASDALVYPLRITAISVRRNTEALFYVQAPEQMDLKDTWSWLWSFRVMWLTSGTVCLSQKQMTPEEQAELGQRQEKIAKIRSEIPGYDTTKLEWARKLSDADLGVLDDPKDKWPQANMNDLPKDAQILTPEELTADFQRQAAELSSSERGMLGSYVERLAGRYPQSKGLIVRLPSKDGQPATYHWLRHREAPEAEVAALTQLKGHLQNGQWMTKFRKSFLKHEMNLDLDMVPVEKRYEAEYIRILPQSPP